MKRKKLTLKQKKAQDERLSTLALKIHRNEVFTSLQVRPEDQSMIPMIFMPLALLDSAQAKQMKKEGAFMIYADYTDQFPRGVNGYPVFGSMSYINEEETKRLVKMVQSLKESEIAAKSNLAKVG